MFSVLKPAQVYLRLADDERAHNESREGRDWFLLLLVSQCPQLPFFRTNLLRVDCDGLMEWSVVVEFPLLRSVQSLRVKL